MTPCSNRPATTVPTDRSSQRFKLFGRKNEDKTSAMRLSVICAHPVAHPPLVWRQLYPLRSYRQQSSSNGFPQRRSRYAEPLNKPPLINSCIVNALDVGPINRCWPAHTDAAATHVQPRTVTACLSSFAYLASRSIRQVDAFPRLSEANLVTKLTASANRFTTGTAIHVLDLILNWCRTCNLNG